jgi:phosphoribosylformylglycinamidine (FGAM) synthase-like enzyme
MSCDCNVRYCYIDPKGGGAAATIEAGRNVAMSGARPLAITDCLNFGNPENPEVMWQFGQACEGIKEACLALNTPVVSGNVSLYNETNGVSVFPTPAIAMVGLNESEDKVLPSTFQEEGSQILLLGETKGEFGGSLYVKALHGETTGSLPKFDYKSELALWEIVIEANKKGLLKSAKDVNVGGVAIALSKMAATSGKGIVTNVPVHKSRNIFDESQSRALVEVTSENLVAVVHMAASLGIFVTNIGSVGGDKVKINDVELPLAVVQDVYFNTFEQTIEQDI